MTSARDRLAMREAARRAAFDAAYQLTDGNEAVLFELEELSAKAGMAFDDAARAADELVGEGRLARRSDDLYGIDGAAARMHARELLHPGAASAPRQAPAITMNFSGPVGAVQTGPDATANVSQPIGIDPGDLPAFLASLRHGLEVLPERERLEASQLVDQLEAESVATSPRAGLVRAAGAELARMIHTNASLFADVAKFLAAVDAIVQWIAHRAG